MSSFAGLPVPQRYWSAATIWLAIALAALDGTIANVALPTIARTLSAPPAEAVWVVNAYQLAIAVSLLPLAALGEMLGFRRVYLGGAVLFTIASLGCTLAHSLPELAGARVIQGLGAAGIMSVNGALVRYTYPPNMLGRGIGLNALVISGSAVLGPTIASAVLAAATWQWLFAINLPIGIAIVLIGRKSLPDSPKSGSVDLIGTALNVVMFGATFVGIDILTRGGRALLGGVSVALGLGAGAALAMRSLTHARPIIPVDLLKNRMFALSVATSIATFGAQTLAFVTLPFFFQGVLHRSQVQTGLLMTPWPLAVCVIVPFAGRLADRYSAAILSGVGLLVMAAGLALLIGLAPDATTLDIAWRMALCGAGFGFFQAPNNRFMLTAAPIERSGAAGGMLAISRIVGQTTGATLTAMIFRLAAHAQTTALAVAAALAGIAALASMARLVRRRGVERPGPAPAAP